MATMFSVASSRSVFLFIYIYSFVARTDSCSVLVCGRKGIFLDDLQALDSGLLRVELSSPERADLTAFFDPTTGCLSTNGTDTGNPVEHLVADDPTEGFVLNVTEDGNATLANRTRSYDLQLQNYTEDAEAYSPPPLLFVSLRLQRAYVIYQDPSMEFLESAVAVIDLSNGEATYSSFGYPFNGVDDVRGTLQVYPDIQLVSVAGFGADCVKSVFASFDETSVSVTSYETIGSFQTKVVAGILPPFFRSDSMFEVVDINKCEDCCKYEATTVVITARSWPENSELNSTNFDQHQLAHLYETGQVCFDDNITSGAAGRKIPLGVVAATALVAFITWFV